MRGVAPTLGYQRNSDTSKQAASDARERAASRRAEVLAKITEAGDDGLTADELCAIFRCGTNSVAPRVSDLKKARKIIDSGKRRTTRQGSGAAVYVAAPGGVQ